MNKNVKSDVDLSDLALSNVEALALNENSDNENGNNMVGYKCKNPNDGVGCGDIGQTGPPCGIKRYC